jgi:hypothetical protein
LIATLGDGSVVSYNPGDMYVEVLRCSSTGRRGHGWTRGRRKSRGREKEGNADALKMYGVCEDGWNDDGGGRRGAKARCCGVTI